MTSHILTILGVLALPARALADSGHIADQSHGHSHVLIYVLLACALFGLAFAARRARP